MGLLKSSKCVLPKHLYKFNNKIKQSALDEFIKIFNYNQYSISKESSTYIMWGYEVEFMIVSCEYDDYKLVLGSEIVLEKYENLLKNEKLDYILMQEFGRYMLETTPVKPFNISNKGEFSIENCHETTSNIFKKIDKLLQGINSFSLIMTTFPLIGYEDNKFTFVQSNENILPNDLTNNTGAIPDNVDYYSAGRVLEYNNVLKSKYFPVNAISIHPRFHSTTNAVVVNRKTELNTRVLIKPNEYSIDKYVKIDSMGQGMGNSCLHVTISINDSFARTCELYDHLVPLTPLMLYLSRATPIIQGKEVLSCHRWEHLSASSDDRVLNLVEPINRLNISPKIYEAGENEKPEYKYSYDKLPSNKSRCSSVDFYLNSNELNDIDAVINIDSYFYLLNHNIPEGVVKMIANELVHEPILLYEDNTSQLENVVCKISNKNTKYSNIKDEPYKNFDKIDTQFDKEDVKNKNFDNFLNIHSTNWRSLRLKIPTDDIWKVEFRTMETQLSSFENCSFAVFVVLYSKVILENNFDYKIPMSLVDINFLLSNMETFTPDNKGFEMENIIKNKILNRENSFRKEDDVYFYKNYKIIIFPTESKSYSPQKFFFKYKNNIGFGCLENIFKEVLPEIEKLAISIGPKTLEKVEFIKKKISGKYKSTSQVLREFFNIGLKENNGNILKANNHLIKNIKEIQLRDSKGFNHLK